MAELCQKLPVVFEIDTEKNRYAEHKLPVGGLSEAANNSQTESKVIQAAIKSAVQEGKPWKTVRQAITDALRASFIELEEGSSWPCDHIEAKKVKLKNQRWVKT